MQKRDLKKELKHLYRASAKHVTEVDVPPIKYLMIDGQGDPNTSAAYAQAVKALFTVSYTLKFAFKKGPDPIDYAVMPLEGLWWADDLTAFTAGDKANWKWTLMIHQPPIVQPSHIATAIATVAKKKTLPALPHLRFETFTEGPSAQILHIGPFNSEGPTIAHLHAHIDTHAEKTGKHHEIYLTDIRRAAPENWKTLLRQPFQESLLDNPDPLMR